MMDDKIDEVAAWAAFVARDRGQDGCFVGAVTTTNIYCTPGCPARWPKREHVVFYRDGAMARRRGRRGIALAYGVGRTKLGVAARR